MIQDKMFRAAEMAVAMMRTEGYCPDFSIRSLDMIDTRIEHFRQEGETSGSMPATMTALGIYVGEVIRRTLGRGEWVEGVNSYRLEIGSIVAHPISKCMKRLDDGPADSVRVFAEVIVLMANMPDEEIQTNLKAAVEGTMSDVTLEVSHE